MSASGVGTKSTTICSCDGGAGSKRKGGFTMGVVCSDLVLIAESMDGLKEKMNKWKECMEAKGLKVNIGKTKVMW